MTSEFPDQADPIGIDLNELLNEHFAGKIVRKDLTKMVKEGANVPVFVLEYLLGKYCASSDPVAIRMGIDVVNKTLSESYVSPDEAAKAQARLKEKGRQELMALEPVRLAALAYREMRGVSCTRAAASSSRSAGTSLSCTGKVPAWSSMPVRALSWSGAGLSAGASGGLISLITSPPGVCSQTFR